VEIVNTSALISINATLLFQLVSFLLYMLIMNRLMFQPLRSAMAQRAHYIRRLKTELIEARKKVEKFGEDMVRRRREVRRQAHELSAIKERQAMDEAGGLVAEAQTRVAAMRQEAEDEIYALVQHARMELAQETEAMAHAIMEKLLDRRIAA
jgi:F-type H+-transporting ATPase subunit b